MNTNILNSGRRQMNEAISQGRFQQAVDAYDQLLSHGHFAPDLQNMAAMAYLKLDQRRLAIRVIEQALQSAPGDIAIQNNAGNIYLICGYWKKARQHLENALSKKPDDPRIRFNLGQVYDQLGLKVDAGRMMHGLLGKDGNNTRLLRQLFNLCRRHGDTDKARAYLMALLEEDRFDAQALYDWTVLNRTTVDDEGLRERLDYCLRQPGLKSDDQASLYFAMAEMHHHSGLHKDACQYYRLANSAVGADFDSQGAQQRFKVLTETIDAPWIERARSLLASDTPPPRMTFIIGMPRSGTTLVEHMLDCHSQVFAAGELSAMHRVVSRLERQSDLKESLSGDQGQGPDAEALRRWRDAFLERLPGDGLQSALITDKSPLNFQYLGLLAALLPNARFVFVSRHPLAITWSCFTNNLNRGVDFTFNLEDIADQLILARDYREYWQGVLGGQMMQLRYEDLVDEPEPVARELLAFCGLEWEASVLAPEKNPRSVSTASVLQVRQPINKAAKRRFETYADCLRPATARLEAAGIDCS